VDAARDSWLSNTDAADVLAVDLNGAIAALGEITGESITEDVLAAVFGSFCVGK